VDYCRLNAATPQVQVYIPNFDELLEYVGTSAVLSMLDLVKGFYQVLLL